MIQTKREFTSRRAFLASGAMLAAASTLRPAAAQILEAREEPRLLPQPVVPDRAWQQLAGLMPKGRVLLPSDPDYRLIALPNNLRYAATPLPQGVARCSSEADVAAALLWAQRNDLPLVTRGGGHSYAGYSTTGGLMIETSLMSQSSYDVRTGVISVQAGARNRDLYTALKLQGRAITHGRCPSVGAAGFLLGGGIGFNMRAHGLACDQLVGSRMVMVDGSITSPTAASTGLEGELFWASRGCGGGNFGVTTRFDLQTFDVSTTRVTVFELTWSSKPETRRRVSVEDLGAQLMKTLEAAPEGLGSRVSFGAVTPLQVAAGYDVPVSVLGQFVGTQSQLEALLRPVTELAAPDGGFGYKEMGYWDAQAVLHEDGYPTFYQERSAFVKNPFGVGDLAAGLDWLRKWPGTYGYCDLRFFQTGGQINATPWDKTAFVHRDSQWLMVVGLYWDEANDHDGTLLARNHDWQNRFYADMRPRAGGGAYQNFADPSLEDYREAYYGKNLPRLLALKDAVDKRGVFNFPQSI